MNAVVSMVPTNIGTCMVKKIKQINDVIVDIVRLS